MEGLMSHTVITLYCTLRQNVHQRADLRTLRPHGQGRGLESRAYSKCYISSSSSNIEIAEPLGNLRNRTAATKYWNGPKLRHEGVLPEAMGLHSRVNC